MARLNRVKKERLLDNLHTVLTLVPWRMSRQITMLVVASFLIALLDLAAVAMMLPLMQVLTGEVQSSAAATRIVVPIIGTENRQAVMLAIALFVGLAFLSKNVGLVLIRWWALGVTNSAMGEAQAAMLIKYVNSDYTSYRRRSKATIIQVITGSIPAAFTQVLLGYIQVTADALTIGVLMTALVAMAPEASILAAAVFGGAALLIARVFKPHAIKLGTQSLELGRESWRSLNPAIEGFREARIFRREKLFTDNYRENRIRNARVVRSQSLFGELPKYILEVVMIFGIMVIALVLFLTRPEGTAFGLLAVFAAAAMRIVPALNRLVATANGIRAGAPQVELAAAEIGELDAEESSGKTRRETDVADSDNPRLSGELHVRDVSFRYPDGHQNVLSRVNVDITEGSTIALVGSSGAGKTTFADLLIGLVTPTEGEILVNESDISKHPREWLASLAMVSQKVYIWDASIRDLITFGLPDEEVDEQLLHDVVVRARLNSLVKELPRGLDTPVGDGGARLSGGQAQRIGIARALYAQPRLLILDEATSALDTQTEYEISQTIESLRGQMTVIIIAHRLSTVKNVDEILFFSGGRLAARGDMRELQRSNEEFARLVRLGSLD